MLRIIRREIRRTIPPGIHRVTTIITIVIRDRGTTTPMATAVQMRVSSRRGKFRHAHIYDMRFTNYDLGNSNKIKQKHVHRWRGAAQRCEPHGLEHFQKYCSHSAKTKGGGLFEFWLRFGSVTGLFKPAPSPKPRQNSKILAPNGYSISSNALSLPRGGGFPIRN